MARPNRPTMRLRSCTLDQLQRSQTSPQRPMHDILRRLLSFPFLACPRPHPFPRPSLCLSGYVKGNSIIIAISVTGERGYEIRVSARPRLIPLILFTFYLTTRLCVPPNHDDSVRRSAATPQHDYLYAMHLFPRRHPSGGDAWSLLVRQSVNLYLQSLTSATNEFLDMNIFHHVCPGWRGRFPMPLWYITPAHLLVSCHPIPSPRRHRVS